MIINPKDIPVPRMHGYLLSSVIPRPIAFASTIDKLGKVNLSPFSFFNCFGANPPILVFSPSRRGRDGSLKHTYENVKEVPEVVINIVNYNMVEQASLSSCEFPKGVNEFIKSGLTEVPSQMVKPPRVEESPVSFECKVNDVIPMGNQGASGNLVICEVLLMHVKDEVLDENGRIDPRKLDAVARMGGDYYLRIGQENIITVPKPNEKLGIGFDQLPDSIRNSSVLTGNDLGRLANVERLPEFKKQELEQSVEFVSAKQNGVQGIHLLAQKLLKSGKVQDAWKVLLTA